MLPPTPAARLLRPLPPSRPSTLSVFQAVVRAFYSGEFNCLVATCIAEEGLDIGEVDLIVSFDALNSPVRMVQRMGRTGRKRAGKVGRLETVEGYNSCGFYPMCFLLLLRCRRCTSSWQKYFVNFGTPYPL